MRSLFLTLSLAAFSFAASGVAAAATGNSCTSLTTLKLPEAHVASAEVVPAGGFLASEKNPAYTDLPAFCWVTVISNPSDDSAITIQIWMPVSKWNGRYLGVGNSGFAGSSDFVSMANALYYGYATAGTDGGHTGEANDASWALGHPEKVIDFGYRAVHQMTLNAKLVIEGYFGYRPKYSYFDGCSDGGREAMMESQRFPDDYNGIVAGDPPYNWTNYMTKGAIDQRALLEEPGSYIPVAKLPTITAAVLASCTKDPVGEFLDNPSTCTFQPSSLLCTGADSDSCLTAAQVTAMETLYAPATLPKNDTVFPGMLPGGESGSKGWQTWITGTAEGNALMNTYAPEYFGNMVYGNPDWTYSGFNLASTLDQAENQTGTALDANSPDLTAFSNNKGKLILYHGWYDPAVAPLNTVNYYDQVVNHMGGQATADFLRVYMVPGMNHCGNGPGPASFGGSGPDTFNTAKTDEQPGLYRALELWVEKGIAPQSIVTYGVVPEGAKSVPMTRPLCPYPQQATYLGKGSYNEASSFSCSIPKAQKK
jgi:feruloyl esterase